MTGTELSKPLQWLLAHTPHETDIALQAKLADIEVKTAFRFPKDGEPYEVIESAQRPRGITQERIDEIINTLVAATAPAPHRDILKWLERLKSITVPRNEAEPQTVERMKNLTEELRAFPADVVKAALHEPMTFFPAWGEIHATLLTLSGRRRRLLDIVRTWRPWSTEDEITYLRQRFSEERHNAHRLAHKDPIKSGRHASEAERVEMEIRRLESGGEMKRAG